MKNLLFASIMILVLASGSFTQWVQLGAGLNGSVRALIIGDFGSLYAGGDFTNSGNQFTGRVASLVGNTWSSTDTMNSFNNSVYALHCHNNYDIYAGGHFNPFIRKYNIASLWTNVSNAALTDDVNAITSIGNNVYAGGSFSWAGNTSLNFIGRWNGTSWSPLDTGLNATVSALAVIGNNLYVGGSFYKTYGGMDLKRIGMWNGHWNQLGTGILNGWVNALAVSGNNLYVGGNFSIVTPNGVAHNIAKWDGTSWSVVGTPITTGLNDEVLCIAVKGETVYAGGFFTSTHGGNVPVKHIAKWDGANWSQMGEGMNAAVRTLCISGNYLYAGGDFITSGTTSVVHVARWGTPIGIQPVSGNIPVEFSLSQNYPNPFNPSTKIAFDIPTESSVKIEVYDITGKRIEELVNENMKAGSYEVDWNASKLSSGTYFYRIQAGRFTETKKMILVK